MPPEPATEFRPNARPAVSTDRDELERLAARALEHLAAHRGGALFGDRDVRTDPVADALTAELTSTAHGSGVVLVGCLGPVVVGYAAAHVETTARSSVSVVDDLYVEPEARGVGVGSALMDALVAHATRAGCSGIESAALPGDRATKNFFEGYGLVARKITVHRSLGADPTSQSAADG